MMRRFVFVAVLIASGWSQARSQCSDPNNKPPDNSKQQCSTCAKVPSGFQPGTTVSVFIQPDPNWDATAISNIQAGIKSWAGTNNVSFNFVANSPPPGTISSPTLTVVRQTPDPGPGAAGYFKYHFQTNSAGTVGYVDQATMQLNTQITDVNSLEQKAAHEEGHGSFLGDCDTCTLGVSVMAYGDTMNGTAGASGPSPCDKTQSTSNSTPPGGGGSGDPCLIDPNSGGCGCTDACSPIIVDTNGTGFDLTSAAGGVVFDISGTGHSIQIAWTAPGAQNAFLCLPDSSGRCDDGKNLFGNFTPQPPSSTPNGFAALAVYDQPANGGNGDGVIDSRDAIFNQLRLWIDANHDGISQPTELYTLPSLGITSIGLNYKWDQRTDQYGNVFRYRAQVGSTSGAGRMAYDVFLVIQTSNGSTVTAQSSPAVQPPRLLPEGKDGVLK